MDVIVLKEPVIEKSLVANTAHITENDNKRLHSITNENLSGNHELIVYNHGAFGYRIYIPDDLYDNVSAKLLQASARISKDLVQLLLVAKEHGCQWLMLDRDGTVYDELPTFEW